MKLICPKCFSSNILIKHSCYVNDTNISLLNNEDDTVPLKLRQFNCSEKDCKYSGWMDELLLTNYMKAADIYMEYKNSKKEKNIIKKWLCF